MSGCETLRRTTFAKPHSSKTWAHQKQLQLSRRAVIHRRGGYEHDSPTSEDRKQLLKLNGKTDEEPELQRQMAFSKRFCRTIYNSADASGDQLIDKTTYMPGVVESQ